MEQELNLLFILQQLQASQLYMLQQNLILNLIIFIFNIIIIHLILIVIKDGFQLDNDCHDFIFTNNEIDNIPYIAIFFYENCYNITVGDINATSIATSTSYSNHIHDFGYAGVCWKVRILQIKNQIIMFIIIMSMMQPKLLLQIMNMGLLLLQDATSSGWPNIATARYNFVENIKTWEGFRYHGGSYIYFH